MQGKLREFRPMSASVIGECRRRGPAVRTRRQRPRTVSDEDLAGRSWSICGRIAYSDMKPTWISMSRLGITPRGSEYQKHLSLEQIIAAAGKFLQRGVETEKHVDSPRMNLLLFSFSGTGKTGLSSTSPAVYAPDRQMHSDLLNPFIGVTEQHCLGFPGSGSGKDDSVHG